MNASGKFCSEAVKKNELLWDSLSKGAQSRGLWQGVQNEQKIVKNEMLVQCNE
jgi:hypothetical protein